MPVMLASRLLGGIFFSLFSLFFEGLGISTGLAFGGLCKPFRPHVGSSGVRGSSDGGVGAAGGPSPVGQAWRPYDLRPRRETESGKEASTRTGGGFGFSESVRPTSGTVCGLSVSSAPEVMEAGAVASAAEPEGCICRAAASPSENAPSRA